MPQEGASVNLGIAKIDDGDCQPRHEWMIAEAGKWLSCRSSVVPRYVSVLYLENSFKKSNFFKGFLLRTKPNTYNGS